MFNTKLFLDNYNIPYRTKGANCSPNFININCFLCNDTNFHLGISIDKPIATCWRCGHVSFYDLVNKLLPNENYKNILEQFSSSYVIKEKVLEKLNKKSSLILSGDALKPIHRQYLIKRGYDPDYLIEKYKIKGTLMDDEYPYRLIIPVFYNNQLVSFQTRTIRNDEPKYLNCKPEKEIKSIKECLYNIDNCKENWILVNEGCFKTFKFGENSVSTFSKNFTKKQILPLLNYDKIFIGYDPDTSGINGAIKLTNILDSLGKEVYNLSLDIPIDEMNFTEIEKLKQYIYKYI
jgi:hypothetical protein